jgi:hypothetical protein
MTSQAMRDKRMRKIVKKLRKRKTKAFARHTRECELYILERKDSRIPSRIEIMGKTRYFLATFDQLIQ